MVLTFGVDGARDTVGETDVELGQGVFLVDGSVRQISDGGGLDHVLNRVSLDGLVLGERSVLVETSPLLVGAAGDSLLVLIWSKHH